MKTLKLFLVLIFLNGTTLMAQNTEYSKEPGYFDFSKLISMKSGDLVTEIYLEEPMLKMLAKMSESKEESLSAAVSALKLIYVNEFMIDKNQKDKFESTVESIDKELQSQKWDRIIRTKRTENLANVYVKKVANDEFVGLIVIALDKEGKATFVNIVGKVDLETIGKVSKEFHIPHLDDKKQIENKK